MYQLRYPLKQGGYSVSCIEVPSPKQGAPYKSGLEHAELVVREHPLIFARKMNDKVWTHVSCSNTNTSLSLRSCTFFVCGGGPPPRPPAPFIMFSRFNKFKLQFNFFSLNHKLKNILNNIIIIIILLLISWDDECSTLTAYLPKKRTTQTYLSPFPTYPPLVTLQSNIMSYPFMRWWRWSSRSCLHCLRKRKQEAHKKRGERRFFSSQQKINEVHIGREREFRLAISITLEGIGIEAQLPHTLEC
jgi:hypothetical protein